MSNLDIRISSETFHNDLMEISTGLVWKNQYLANLNEVKIDAKRVDQFMSANKKLINFDSIWEIDIDVLSKAGLTPEQIDAAMDNKYSIPIEKRDIIVSLQLKKFLATDRVTGRFVNYEERNNYYRMLYGLPDLEDENFIYVTDEPHIDPFTPIHELSISDCHYLEDIGIIEELIKKYPKKKYLKYIGKKRIDPYTSRSKERYDIMWMKTSSNSTLNEQFQDTYDNCRQLVMRTYFRKDMLRSNTYYESFLAMCILFMTINLMHYKYLESDITRDFFDEESLKFVYESYGVPFFPNIPLMYHKKIVKNLNILLSYKGSTRVFFELFDLFDYGNIDIFYFYILKKHKLDTDGLPIFVYKEDGTIDNSQTYDVRFGQVRLYDNPPLELMDPLNQFNYQEVIADDPYWVSDAELMEKLYNQKYNYMESKYLGIRTVFDMMKIVYESSYFIKMLIDNRELLNKTLVYYNATGGYHDIFSITIYLCAIVCRKHGYETLISSKLPTVSKYLGYNFKANITEVREFILNNQYLQDDIELLESIRYMNVNSMESINNTFKSIMDLRSFLLNRMWESKHSDEYLAYKNLFNTLMISDTIEDVFRKSDGTVAESFETLLGDIDLTLYDRLMLLEGEELHDEMNILFALYERSLDNIKWIRFSDGIDLGPLMDQLYSLMKYFKSAKAEMVGFNIIYTISTPAANFFKLMGYIESSENEGDLQDDKFSYLIDVLHDIETTTKIKDKFTWLKDECSIPEDIYYIDSKIKFLTDLLFLQEHFICITTAELNLIDDCLLQEDNNFLTSIIHFADEHKLIWEDVLYEVIHYVIPDDKLSLSDIIYRSEQLHLDPFISYMLLKDNIMENIDNIIFDSNLPTKLDLSSCIYHDKENINKEEYLNFTCDLMRTEDIPVNGWNSVIKVLSDSLIKYSENNEVKDTQVFTDSLMLLEEVKF